MELLVQSYLQCAKRDVAQEDGRPRRLERAARSRRQNRERAARPRKDIIIGGVRLHALAENLCRQPKY